MISDLERSLLDAAARPELVGGAAVLAEAISSAGTQVDPERLRQYAEKLKWEAALRRIGSVSDTLDIKGLSGKLRPHTKPQADLDLEPTPHAKTAWRDSRWRIRWTQPPDELANVARQ
jgi:predicted transcriptional regulator of viral defense system